jgi:hypothetical protein
MDMAYGRSKAQRKPSMHQLHGWKSVANKVEADSIVLREISYQPVS